MPIINISEKQLRRTAAILGTDIPFIPGFATGVANGAAYETPKLCQSVRDLERYFGAEPVKFNVADTNLNIKVGDYDKSYIMAKELLNLGMPVYYYAFDGTAAAAGKKEVDVLAGFTVSDVYISGTELAVHDGDVTIACDIKAEPDEEIKWDALKDFDLIYTPGSTHTEGSLNIKVKKDKDKHDVLDLDEYPVTLTLRAYVVRNVTDTFDTFYSTLATYFGGNDLKDKNEYTIKYITTGGYPNFGNAIAKYNIYQSMIDIASARGDAIALVEASDDRSRALTGDGSFFEALKTASITSPSYAAAFTPWAKYSLVKKYDKLAEAIMPACFGYLADLALNIKTSPNWLAMAGTTRGLVPNILELNTDERLSNVIAHEYQPTTDNNETDKTYRALNAITDVKPYGYTIWGNRTLERVMEELTPLNMLNIRNMISDIKKVAYKAAKAQMFEQNTEALWLNFKSEVSPYLDKLKSGNGISDYKLIKTDYKADGTDLKRHEFACAITIYPLYAVEAFDINVMISGDDVDVD